MPIGKPKRPRLIGKPKKGMLSAGNGPKLKVNASQFSKKTLPENVTGKNGKNAIDKTKLRPKPQVLSPITEKAILTYAKNYIEDHFERISQLPGTDDERIRIVYAEILSNPGIKKVFMEMPDFDLLGLKIREIIAHAIS